MREACGREKELAGEIQADRIGHAETLAASPPIQCHFWQGLFATAYQDLLKDAHILIGTPDYLARAAVSGKLRLHQVRAYARRARS